MKTKIQAKVPVIGLTALMLASCGFDQLTGSTEQPADSTPVETSSEEPETLMRMGDFARERGEIGSAITLYRQAHSADTQAIEPLLKLGSALSEAGEFDQSAGAFRTALTIDANNVEARRGLGNAKINLGRPADALEDLNAGLEIEESASILNSIGVAHDLLGQHGDASTAYQRALELSPNDLDLGSNWAVSQSLAGNHQAAIARMSEVANAPAATPRHRRNLAMVLAFAGDDTAALNLLSRELPAAEVESTLQRFVRWRGIEDSGARAAAINAGA